MNETEEMTTCPECGDQMCLILEITISVKIVEMSGERKVKK